MERLNSEQRDRLAAQFYIEDHMLVYGLLGQASEEIYGNEWESALTEATVLYARERGERMARRCRRDGREPSMKSFLLYSELADIRRQSCSRTTQVVPCYLNTVERCAWHDVCVKYDIVKYGSVYCSCVDRSILCGFNPQLKMELRSVIMHGDKTCEFEWCDAGFESEQEFRDLMSLKYAHTDENIRDFLYHTAHVLSALTRSFAATWGETAANQIRHRAMQQYGTIMGDEKKRILQKEAEQNFSEIR